MDLDARVRKLLTSPFDDALVQLPALRKHIADQPGAFFRCTVWARVSFIGKFQ